MKSKNKEGSEPIEFRPDSGRQNLAEETAQEMIRVEEIATNEETADIHYACDVAGCTDVANRKIIGRNATAFTCTNDEHKDKLIEIDTNIFNKRKAA